MLQFTAGWRAAASLLTVLTLFPGHEAAFAQAADPFDELKAPLDPAAPLDPMPDLGLDWPVMDVKDQTPITASPAFLSAETGSARPYRILIQGVDEVEEEGLVGQFLLASVLEQNRAGPANAAQLDRRAREDRELLIELLRSRGYYDAYAVTQIAGLADGSLQVTLTAEPGPLYRFVEVRLPGLDAAEQAAVLRSAFDVEEGDPVDAAAATAAEARLRSELGRRGYAFAEVGAMEVEVDHATRTARLILPVSPQGARRFGDIVIDGAQVLTAGHIQTMARFEPGEPYRAPLVEDLRQALVATGLVSAVTVRPVEREGSDVVDIAVAVQAAPVRTIAGEIGYGTGEGFRVEASWQHRNLIGPEGALTLRGVAGTREQSVAAIVRRGNFRERDQVLTAQIAASNIDRPAYEARTFGIAAGVERQTNLIWRKHWTWSAGGELIATDERDVDLDSGLSRRRTFFIGALPGQLAYDGSNDLLDPTSGFRLAGRFSPELALQDDVFGYSRTQIDGSFYQTLRDNLVLAGRARIGSILGAGLNQIAPSRRFYAGGGGSVRGYGFQRLGPRDPVFNDPIGGRSLAEFALETRIRMGDFGIVPFLDAGNIYASAIPDISDLRFGAGLGLRYHTRFGPIRVDVGTPLDRQPGDSRVAVHVSLGQAF
jgi:translocation and assembly module TamA